MLLPAFDSLQAKLMGFNTDIRIANLNMDLSGQKVKVENMKRLPKIEVNWSQLNYEQVVSEITSNLRTVYSNAQAVLQNYINIKDIAADPSLSESTFLLLKAGEISFPEYLAEVQLIFENQQNFLEVERDYFLLLNKIALLTGY